MDNGIEPKPNLIELDEERSKLFEKILISSSNNARLNAYLNYFSKILSYNRPNIEEAFLSEFLEDYLSAVKRYEVWGNDPELTRKIFEQVLIIKDRVFTEDYTDTINEAITRLESRWTEQTNILNGTDAKKSDYPKAYFPVIDNEAPLNCYGLIESVTVRINKMDGQDKFIIIPSEKEIEQRIEEQIKISWQLALNISNKNIRKHNQYHEVIISFDKKVGFYVGNSLGISLTLTFLEQILKFYNPTYIINISDGSAFTGGIDKEGNVLNTGEDIIKRKVAAIFFSNLNSFVIPKLEETYAYFALEQLKKVYPQRKLKLITAEDINDILNRRDLVEIKKQKAIVRTGRFVKKNWISAVATVLLAILFAYLFVMDFDNNPDNYFADGQNIYVKNKKGKIIWSVRRNIDKSVYGNPAALKNFIKLYDLNNDGIKEILYSTEELDDDNNKFEPSKIIAIKNLNDTIWTYNFKDSVHSEREELSPRFSSYIIDIINLDGNEVLICWAQNATSFANAVYLLNAKSGQRLNATHWCAGHITNGLLLDVNNDGKQDLVMTGIDNGFEDAVFWAVEFNELDGYRITIPSYIIEGKKKSKLLFYFRIPKTDYEKFMGFRSPNIDYGSLSYINNEKAFRFVTLSSANRDMTERLPLIEYQLKPNIKDFNLYISSSFRVKRDTLVVQGHLNEPFTDTKEYIEIQKNSILYWNDKNWFDTQGNKQK